MTGYAPRPISLPANLALYVVTPLLMNGMIFGLGWQTSRPTNPMLPPGWVVGSIWMVLFIAMGVSRWMLVHGPVPNWARWVDVLALMCLAYPLYTIGLRSEKIGLAGAMVTAAFAAIAIVRVSRASRTAGLWLLPVLGWLLYAETALARGLRS